jgi:hypothetical protein
MSIVASLIKITALAVALLFVDVQLMGGPIETASASKAPRAQCRIYFGCTPPGRLAAGTTDSQANPR